MSRPYYKYKIDPPNKFAKYLITFSQATGIALIILSIIMSDSLWAFLSIIFFIFAAFVPSHSIIPDQKSIRVHSKCMIKILYEVRIIELKDIKRIYFNNRIYYPYNLLILKSPYIPSKITFELRDGREKSIRQIGNETEFKRVYTYISSWIKDNDNHI